MPSLDQIEQEILNVLETEEMDGPDFAMLAEDYLEELARQESDKVDALAFMVRKLNAEADFLKAECDRIAAKKRSIENNVSRLKNYSMLVMERHGLTKLKGRESSMSIRQSTSVVVHDIDNIPHECIREKLIQEPDKKMLKEYIESGMQIPGASLVYGKSLIFR